MPPFKRLVAQVHDIEADTPAQADEIARIRADAINAGMRVLGHGAAWTASVADGVSGADELMEILTDVFLWDEIAGEAGTPLYGYIAMEYTMIPERLMAWRDAAVKNALDAAIPSTVLDDLTAIQADATMAITGQADELGALRRIRSAAHRVADALRAPGVPVTRRVPLSGPISIELAVEDDDYYAEIHRLLAGEERVRFEAAVDEAWRKSHARTA